MDRPWLSETRSWKGRWWLPDDPDRQVAGILTYEPGGGLSLDLAGGFHADIWDKVGPGAFDLRPEPRTWPVLHGLARNKKVTLLDCGPKHSSYGFADPTEQTINALTALVGVHLSGRDDEVFTQCHISLEELNLWSSSSVFGSTFGFEDGRLNGKASLSVKPVKEPSVFVDDTTIALAHEHTVPPHFERKRGSTVGRITDTVFLKLKPEHPWPLSTVQEYVKKFQDLLSLATHRACGILWLRLKMLPEERDYPEGYPISDREVHVYSRHTVTGDPQAKALNDDAVLFTCGDLPFEEVVPRWLTMRQNYEAASNLILSLHYAPPRYIEGRLLMAVGAAEVMHRALGIDEPPIPIEEFKNLRKALLEHVPNEHKGWFNEKLSNVPTLRSRLRVLAKLPDQEAMARLVPNVKQWAELATQARNDLAHQGKTPRQSIDELIVVVKVTSAVVVMNLLQVLGVPGGRQREIINDHPQLSQTARQARDRLTSSQVDDESTPAP